MPTKPKLTEADHEALRQIRELLRKYPGQYGRLDDPLTLRYAQELLHYRPSEAIIKAEEFRQQFKAHNDREEELTELARQRRDELKARPVYSLGYGGIIGVFLRSIMASINWTPLSSPNWYELTERGLIVHTPLANVTERVVMHRDLQEKRLELGVNPPAYLDRMIGFLKQIRISYRTPWGQITLREPGSGVTLAEVVEIRPDEKLAQIRKDLATLHRVANPYATHLILPKIVDFFSYYIDEWDEEYHLRPPATTQLAENPSEEA